MGYQSLIWWWGLEKYSPKLHFSRLPTQKASLEMDWLTSLAHHERPCSDIGYLYGQKYLAWLGSYQALALMGRRWLLGHIIHEPTQPFVVPSFLGARVTSGQDSGGQCSTLSQIQYSYPKGSFSQIYYDPPVLGRPPSPLSSISARSTDLWPSGFGPSLKFIS